MENKLDIQEYEINIREYINVIIKRKKLILAIFLLSVVTAAIVSLRMPKVYEITSIVQLGSINELLIRNEDAKAIMLNQNSLLSLIKKLGLKTGVDSLEKSIKIDGIKDTNLLKIKIMYSDIDIAIRINEAIVNPFITQGQSIYQERIALINERLNEIDKEIKNAEGDMGRIQAFISSLPNANNISQLDASLRIILLQNILPNYESNLSALRNQRNGLKLLLANAKDFKVFDAPIKPKSPIGPNKKQNVLIAGMFSLMLGIFLAFILEFWQKSKKSSF